MKIRFVFFLLVTLLSNSFVAQDLTELNKLIDKHSRSNRFEHAQWSLFAEYLEEGKVLLDYDSEKAVAPASGLKVFTSITALDKLGEDHKFETKIYYDGVIENNVLQGNIYIMGGGDPCLGSDQVEGALPLKELLSKIISDISKLGIKEIKGSVVADNSLFEFQPIPDHWEYIDIGNYYGASSSALSINDNLYYLFFEPSDTVGELARILRTEPVVPGLKFTNFMKTGKEGSGDNGYIYCPPLHYYAFLQGSIPQGNKEFSIKGSIPDPPLFTAQLLTQSLIENGISISEDAQKLNDQIDYQPEKLISTIESPPLKNIVYVLNKRSSNLYAEILLKNIALKETGIGATHKGIQVVQKFLNDEGINTDALNLYDGSGLSRANSITAKMMVELLSAVTRKSYFKSFYNSLGVMGDPSDLGFFKYSGRGTALENNARVKSGVIQGVRSYSGYLKDKNGKTIVYSLIANNFSGGGGAVSGIHREIMNELANLK